MKTNKKIYLCIFITCLFHNSFAYEWWMTSVYANPLLGYIPSNIYVYNNTPMLEQYYVKDGSPGVTSFILNPGQICEMNKQYSSAGRSPIFYADSNTSINYPLEIVDVNNNVGDGIYMTGNSNIDLCSNEGDTRCYNKTGNVPPPMVDEYSFSLGVVYHGDIYEKEQSNRSIGFDFKRAVVYSGQSAPWYMGYFILPSYPDGFDELYYSRSLSYTQTDFIFVENYIPNGGGNVNLNKEKLYPKNNIDLTNITSKASCFNWY